MAQYTTDDNLAKRIAIHRYGENPISWPEWYFSHVKLDPGSRVLDVGCGNAYMWTDRHDLIDQASEIVLADASLGMVNAARKNVENARGSWSFQVASVEDLPFGAESFDVVMANHMLYHASNVDVAVSEIARVLKPRGRLYASTIGAGHMRQLGEWADAVGLQGVVGIGEPARRFGLENGRGVLSRFFRSVRLFTYQDALSVPAVQPVLEYVRSMEPGETREVEEKMSQLQARLARELQEHGRIRIDKESGLFAAEGVKK